MNPILKKGLCYFLILAMFMALVGCSKKYESSKLSLYDKEQMSFFELTDEQSTEILTLWNEAKWERGLTKTAWQYEFVLDDGNAIRYSSIVPGRFSDVDGKRTVELTKEQTLYVNSIIKEQAKVQIDLSAARLTQESTEQSVSISIEHMAEFFHIWNNSEWDVINYWPEYDYWFLTVQGAIIGYESEAGIFQYANRRITVSEEQRQQINALIEQQFAQ